jgi:hypothetical protein
MLGKKETKRFYVSVEGNTEKLYFEHLQKLVNNCNTSKSKLFLSPEINKRPKKFIRNKNIPAKSLLFHFFDYENNEQELFLQTLKDIDDINKQYQNKITYKAGYSNLTFEVWLLLHKTNFKSPVFNQKDYLTFINKLYNVNFETLDKYKQEENFKKQILSKITLDDVLQAIKNAKNIRVTNEITSKKAKELYGVKYFLDNPDLTIHECVAKILKVL